MLFFPYRDNQYNKDPDVIYMLAFIKGDQHSFDVILQRNYTRVHAFISRMISNEVQGEDLTQEVFIKLYGMKHSYKPTAKLSTLIFQMARNAALNYLRDHKQYLDLDEHIETASAITTDQSLNEQELAQHVKKAIDSLPENQRTAVLLRRFEDMPYEQIAQVMKISPKAVKSLLNRAKENLKILLKEKI